VIIIKGHFVTDISQKWRTS